MTGTASPDGRADEFDLYNRRAKDASNVFTGAVIFIVASPGAAIELSAP